MDEEELRAYQVELNKREADLKLREELVVRSKKEVDDTRQFLLEKEADFSRREQEHAAAIAFKEGLIAQRERQAVEKELNADAGFAEQNRQSIASLLNQREALVADIRKLESQLASGMGDQRAAMDDELRQERGVARERIEADLAELRKHLAQVTAQTTAALADFEKRQAELQQASQKLGSDLAQVRLTRFAALEQELDKEAACRREELAKALATQRALFEKEIGAGKRAADETMRATRLELEEFAKKLSSENESLVRRERELRTNQTILAEDTKQLQKQIDRRVQGEVTERDRRIEQMTRQTTILKDRCTHLENQVESHEEIRRRLGNQDPETILQKLRERDDEIQNLHQQLVERPPVELKQQYEALSDEQSKWRDDRLVLTKQLAILQSQQVSWQLGVAELENQRKLREMSDRRREAVEAQIEALSKNVADLRSLYEQPEEIEKRIGVINHPTLKRQSVGDGRIDEQLWLKQIQADCARSGLVFPKRLLVAMHTAFKTAEWSPLAVLAGVSGTGKSQMPQLYARFGGMNFLPLSVQPNWDSPQSIFGFFNSVDNRFNATPLLQLLTQSQRDPSDGEGLNDQMSLVLLDEMNLAHVELYFSDILSKLEMRRGELQVPQLEIDLGAGLHKHGVALGRNVLWCGTMNEDETTKTLSDKVLDRGNLIVFPRPTALNRRQKPELSPPRPQLPRATWDRWVVRESTFSDEQVNPFKTILEEMNTRLERVGRALGHRVWQSVEYYMANHPDVICAPDAVSVKAAMARAFEDQLVQKVMPKLRGIETSGKAKTECLDKISGLLANQELGFNLAADFEHACSVGYGSFQWKSAKYLEAEQ